MPRANILDGKKVSDKYLEEPELKLKNEKKIINSHQVEYPIMEKKDEGNLERNTNLVLDAGVNLKQNKNYKLPNAGMKSDTQMISEDEVNILASGEDFESRDLDWTLVKIKKMRNDLQMEDSNKEKKDVVEMKHEKNNASLHEVLKNHDQRNDSKDDRNLITDGRIVDELDLTDQKKESRVKNGLSELEYPTEDKKDEEHLAVGKIHQDMEKLLPNDQDCDVRFFVRGKEFRGHTAIFIDQSAFFASIFQPEIAKGSNLVVIDDSDPKIFEIFLKYVYSGHKKILTINNVFSLYSIGNKYSMQKLKTECLQFMKNISVDTFCDILTFSLHQKEMEIVKFATDYFSKNATEITATSKWQIFLKENSTFANELIIKVLK